jgi:hypothetical protein
MRQRRVRMAKVMSGAIIAAGAFAIGIGVGAAVPARAATASAPDLAAYMPWPTTISPGIPTIGDLQIANFGNAPATGITTVTISVPSTITLQGVMYYTCSTSPPGTCTLTETVSPDGHTVVLTYTGTIAPGEVLSDFQVDGAITAPPVVGSVASVTIQNAGDVNPSNTTSAVYGGPPPTVTSMTPTSGAPGGGTTITLTGTNLGMGQVTIGGASDTSTFCDNTMCTAVTPGGPTTAAVVVTTVGGTVSAGTFTYTSTTSEPPPVVTAITPTKGPAAGGTVVTVTGTNLTGGNLIFGSTPTTQVTYCFSTSCTGVSPPGSGTVDVHVQTFWGTSTARSADRFTYQSATPPPPPPSVSGISPASGPAGGGTSVTVTGSNLAGGRVAFGSAAATGVTCTSSSCTATSPAGSGTVDVTVTTTNGTSATGSADRFTYQASTPPPPPPPPPSTGNLIPDPGFETGGVPADNWGSSLTRSATEAHSGTWSLAQTTSSSSGGWDLDSNSSWYAPVTTSTTYTASIWVWTTKALKVDLNVDLLNSGGNYVNSANGPTVTLVAGTWTQLTITGIKATTGELYAAMEPNFSGATKGTVIYWDDMSLTSP